MQDEIKKHFESVFHLLMESDKIIIPDEKVINSWNKVVAEWITDESMTLFARKGGEVRGTKIINSFGRNIITTDNTPAHWVCKKILLEKEKITKDQVKRLLDANEFPISFIRKKTEYDTLIGKMVADKSIRVNELGWKLAHINRIALKRGKNIVLDDYMTHHLNFLSLGNIYLIDKKYSGLAEVDLFNEIVSNNRKAN